jgi:hypothetical protein
MHAILIHGIVFFGRSKNYSSNLYANFQCHVVHSVVRPKIKFENETLNNFTKLICDQSPQLLVFNEHDLNFSNPTKINFRKHFCEYKGCEKTDFFFFPYCSECFLNIICKNLVSVESSKLRLKATQEIQEKTVIFAYFIDCYSSADMVINDYMARNIPIAAVDEFCIEVKDNDDDETKLYDYSDHLSVLHYIKSSEEEINEVINCKISCDWKEGKYYLQLVTTKNIPKDDILIQKERKERTKKYCTKYIM